jgi:Protein of unknown function (DUF3631)
MDVAGGVGEQEFGNLLDRVHAFVRRYVVLAENAAVIVTVWIAHVYAFRAFEFTPYLAVTSATKRSGKSRLLEVVEVMLGTERCVSTANISPASLFRLIDANPGLAVLFDEIDRIPKDKADDLWGLINSGWRLGGKAHRQSGVRMETLTAFSTFSPKVLCGIGRPLPDTVDDRSLAIRMERRLPSESVERLRLRKAGSQVAPIRDALAEWANDATIERLSHAEPEFPASLTNDRLMDVAEPLLAIADEAAGEWSDRVRRAVLALEEVGREIAEDELAVLALRHLFEAFVEKKVGTAIFTEDLLAHMVKLDDGPWAEWWGEQVETGKIAVPARRLRKLLDRFDKVKPTQVRIGDVTRKGYRFEPVQIAASRYLSETPETSETPLASAVSDVSDVSDTPSDGARERDAKPEPRWRRIQGDAGEEPETDESAALELLKRELGATEPGSEGNGQADPQAEFIRLWNADVYAQAKARREAEEEER